MIRKCYAKRDIFNNELFINGSNARNETTMSIPKPTLKNVKLDSLVLNHAEYNPARFTGGQIYGVNVKDNMDIDGMIDQLLNRPDGQEPGIQRPLSAIQVDKEIIVFAGFRRATAATKLKALGLTAVAAMCGDENKAKQLMESFDRVPVNVYPSTGTTEGDFRLILSLGNDQDQKGYNVSGLLNAVWALQASRYGFKDIVKTHGDQILRLTNEGRTKLAEIEGMPDLKARAGAKEQALKGRLQDEWMKAYSLGARVKKAFFTSMLRQDALTQDVAELKLSRERLKLFGQAKEKDGVNWTPAAGGPLFNLLFDKFIKEDTTPKQPQPKSTAPKSEEVNAALNTFNSHAVRETVQWMQGTQGADIGRVELADADAYRFQIIKEVWLKKRTEIKNGVAADMLDNIMKGDPLTFETFLAKFF